MGARKVIQEIVNLGQSQRKMLTTSVVVGFMVAKERRCNQVLSRIELFCVSSKDYVMMPTERIMLGQGHDQLSLNLLLMSLRRQRGRCPKAHFQRPRSPSAMGGDARWDCAMS